MPKAEAGSIKDIGKRIKAKGLQKLKFYCQMCHKQCRDANGFKCHLTSENHLRQMKLFSTNAHKYMDQYSKEFEQTFLNTVKTRHTPGTRVNANQMYQEVIRDKDHIHMNSTIWVSLSDFCMYLGKTGKCIVEQDNEKDGTGMWYITYIDRNPETLARKEKMERKLLEDQQAEMIYQQQMDVKRLEAQKEFMTKVGVSSIAVEATCIQSTNSDGDDDDKKKIVVQLQPPAIKTKTFHKNKVTKRSIFDDDDDNDDSVDNNHSGGGVTKDEQTFAATSTMITSNTATTTPAPTDPVNQPQREAPSTTKDSKDEIHDYDSNKNKKKRQRDSSLNDDDDTKNHCREKRKTKYGKQKKRSDDDDDDDNDDSPWLCPKLIVRIVTKSLADGRYFKKKAIVDAIYDDGYTADVVVFDNENNDATSSITTNNSIRIRIDQEDLQTVAPKYSTTSQSSSSNQRPQNVCIVRGKYRGYIGSVMELHKKHTCATIQLLYKTNDNKNAIKQQQQQAGTNNDANDTNNDTNKNRMKKKKSYNNRIIHDVHYDNFSVIDA